MPFTPLGGEIPLQRLRMGSELFSLLPCVFGRVVFVHDLDKLSLRSTKCVFAGYSRTQRGYHCLHPPSRKYFVYADVTFFESQPYFGTSTDDEMCVPLPYPVNPSSPIENNQVIVEQEMPCPLQVYRRRQRPPQPPQRESSSSTAANQPNSDLTLPIALRKGKKTPIAHPIFHFVCYNHLSPSFCSFVLSISSKFVPKNYHEALLILHWKVAMDEEMEALRSHGT